MPDVHAWEAELRVRICVSIVLFVVFTSAHKQCGYPSSPMSVFLQA
jgi:hypothetical protein